MTGRSTEVCPKTESTVFKVWVIVCSVDSFCHFVPFRFFFFVCQFDGNSRHKIVECVSAASVGVTSFFAHHAFVCTLGRRLSQHVLRCVFAWIRTLEFVEAKCWCIVALFSRDAAPCSWVHHHVGLRHFDRMNEKG